MTAFAEVGREPRLEFFAELWPSLPGALERAGFALETAAPALALSPRDEAWPLPSGVIILDAIAGSDLTRAFLEEIQAAFGVPPPLDEAELARFRGDLAEGATMAAARIEGGRPVAGACLIGIDDGEAEMAGVWSGTSHRRRGHATAACTGLTSAFFGEGGRLVWLSAADDEIEPLYRRLGFVRAGTQLNYALTGGAFRPPS